MRSNIARARVIVSGGVFTTDACVVGMIFADRNGNGLQDPDEPGVPDVHLNFEEGTIARQRRRRQVQLLRPHADDACPPRRSNDAACGRRIDDEQQSQRGQRRQSLHRSEVWRSPSRGLHRRRSARIRSVLEEIGVRRERAEDLGAVVRRAGASGDHRWPAGDRERRNRPSGCGRCADGSRRGARRPADSNRSGRRAASARRTRMRRSRCRLTLVSGAVDRRAHARRDAAVHGTPADAGGRSAGRRRVCVARRTEACFAPTRPDAAFDREFRRFSRSFNGGQGQVGGRGALFVKGTVARALPADRRV